MTAPEVGTSVVHRRYVPFSDAHYAGNLVDGAYSMKLFGDVATELCIRTDGDEGLLASYSDVQFHAPVRAGDVLEITCTLTRVGTRSRGLDLSVHVVARGEPTVERPGAARPFDEPLLATSATATVVVPPPAG
ncbi:hotdog domain-containing protein [Nocardioides halotolerans]|uniref:3-aminobutyryl-CoA ammonia lyase n=1 Tax=Nocardioides halotolerans TaxID=433660 RepID=UPI000414A747|nr:hotdog domain-containing protein [Nocardioides halotolerans]